MSFLKTISSIATLTLLSVATMAQETSLDLRKDGRVVTGDRSNNFVRSVKSFKTTVSDNLRNKLINTVIAAIVIPPGKTAIVISPGKTVEKYLIGIVPGDGTLPDDWTVTEDDFKVLRDMAINKRMSRVDAANRKMRAAAAQNNKAEFEVQTVELTRAIAGDTDEAKMAASYAGYVLQDFPKAMEVPALASIVNKYREEEVRSLQPAIVRAVRSNQLAVATPVLISESEDFITAKDLGSAIIEHKRAPNGVSYLILWYQRSLVIVPERLDMPFNDKKYKNLFDYLSEANPAASIGIVVADSSNKLRDRSFDAPSPKP